MDIKSIKDIRRFRKKKIKDIAKITKLSRYTISDLENGRGNPRLSTVTGVLGALNCELKIVFK